MQNERLIAHLTGWGHAHEDTAEGWIADALGAFFCLAVFWAAMAVLAC